MCDDAPKIGSDGFARYRKRKMQSQEIDCRCVHIKRKSSICQALGRTWGKLSNILCKNKPDLNRGSNQVLRSGELL